MQWFRVWFWSLAVVGATVGTAISQEPRSTQAPAVNLGRQHLADYDSELRLKNGRVDSDGLLERLKELGANTYYWLVWHAATDWDDLQVFLPKAAQAGIEVWVYLVPPSESPPQYVGSYSEPFRLDYLRWAEEIARLSLKHANLTAWVIDDFYANREFFKPAYLQKCQERAKGINPRLAFLPLMYFREVRPNFVEDYRGVIDGVVVAYLQDREEIERTWALALQLRHSLQAYQDGKCDGVVTYCLDKGAQSRTFPSIQELFHQFRVPGSW